VTLAIKKACEKKAMEGFNIDQLQHLQKITRLSLLFIKTRKNNVGALI
jgi:hypothetical protein